MQYFCQFSNQALILGSHYMLTIFSLFSFLLYPVFSRVYPCQYILLLPQYLSAVLLILYIFFISHCMPHGTYNTLLDFSNVVFLSKYNAQFIPKLVEITIYVGILNNFFLLVLLRSAVLIHASTFCYCLRILISCC
jgi:hypothetical protein